MQYRKKYRILLLLVSCILSHAAALKAQIPAPDAPLQTNEDRKKLVHFGDLIDVDVVGSSEYDWRGSINPEGFLDGIDFVEEPVYALCRSESEIAAAIAQGFSKILRDPKIEVRVLDRSNRALSILQGAVRKSQRFQIKRAVHLNELLILAGGLTEKTSGEIQIFRPQNQSCLTAETGEAKSTGAGGEIRERFVKASKTGGAEIIDVRISDLLSGKSEANPQILTGDIITVLEAEPLYVIGGVNNPKQIPIRTETTLTRAIASAGGLAKDAAPESVTIFRRENGETKILEANLTKIAAGAAADIVLKKLDIVEVGQKGREKRKLPPVVKMSGANDANPSVRPVLIID